MFLYIIKQTNVMQYIIDRNDKKNFTREKSIIFFRRMKKPIGIFYRWTKNAILNVIATYSQHETMIEAIVRKHGKINVTMRKTHAPTLDANCDNSMGRGDRSCIF